MAKKKLQRFAEIETFPNVFYMPFDADKKDFRMKGRWKEYFGNDNPLVLELGCGKGEYTIGLAERHPQRNFIGIDIKGNRIWRGAKTALERNMRNVAFLRTRIDFIESAFGSNEVSEVWITFPDPQPKKENKRLTCSLFTERYRNLLRKDGFIHLKTDNKELYDYTLEVIGQNNYRLLDHTADLYAQQDRLEEAKSIQTFYESGFLREGKKICYIRFQL
ncbi:MAG: tRNA (guanosine(46)-N7)-methyltransferase TrmB [Bacteroidota bacterium]